MGRLLDWAIKNADYDQMSEKQLKLIRDLSRDGAQRFEESDPERARFCREQLEAAEDALSKLADRPARPPTGSAAIICPHCHERGHVQTSSQKRKSGISGGKATGALLTGGLSLLFTGLSREERITRARCGICKVEWVL